MIKSLVGLAFRFFQSNKFMAISTIISIMLSISLIITMSQLSVNSRTSLQQETTELFGDMDLSIGYDPEMNKVIDGLLLKQLTSSPQIDKYSSVLITQLQVDNLKLNTYTVGVENDNLVKSKYHFKKNLSKSDVIINQALADALQLTVGDNFQIDSSAYNIVEIIPDLNASGITTDMLLMQRGELEELLHSKSGKENKATYLLVKVKKGTDLVQLIQMLKLIDGDLRIDVAEQNDFLVSNLQSLNIFMIVVTILVLIVSSLFIISNSESFMYKYKNQMAIMRSIGTTRTQLFKIVMLQLGMMNVIGAVSGYALAAISNTYAQKWLSELMGVQTQVVSLNNSLALITMILGMIVIQMVMFIPAYRSSRILPLKIIQNNENNDFSNKRLNKAWGVILLVIGVIFMFLGFFKMQDESHGLYFVVASLFWVMCIFQIFPIYLPLLLKGIAPLLRKLIGDLAYIAIQNIIPQVRKNVYILYTISILIIITIVGSTLFETIKKNSEQDLKIQFPTNVVVTSRAGYNSTVEPFKLAESAIGSIGSANVSTISTAYSGKVIQNGRQVSLTFGLADLTSMERQGILPQLDSESKRESIVVSRDFARKNHLQRGGKLNVLLYSGLEQKDKLATTVSIAAIVDKLPGSYFDAYVDWSNVELHTPYHVFSKMFISSDDADITNNQLATLKQMYPGQLEFNSYDKAVERSNSMLLQRWSIFIIFLIIIFISVLMGVCNSLLNNIYSKRKEYAVLRTLSVTKKGLLMVIMTQVNLYVFVGVVLGVINGLIITFVFGLIDGSGLNWNIKIIFSVVLLLFLIAFVVFIPVARQISKLSLTLELTQDNK